MTRFLSGLFGTLLLLFALGLSWNIMAGAAAAAHKSLWDYMVLNTYNKWVLLSLLWHYSPAGVITFTAAGILAVILFFIANRDPHHQGETRDKPHDPNLRA